MHTCIHKGARTCTNVQRAESCMCSLTLTCRGTSRGWTFYPERRQSRSHSPTTALNRRTVFTGCVGTHPGPAARQQHGPVRSHVSVPGVHLCCSQVPQSVPAAPQTQITPSGAGGYYLFEVLISMQYLPVHYF